MRVRELGSAPNPESITAAYPGTTQGTRGQKQDEPGAARVCSSAGGRADAAPPATYQRRRQWDQRGRPFGVGSEPMNAASSGSTGWPPATACGGSRLLIALALTVILFAFAFDAWGFRPDQGSGQASF